jgi:hypothetical protein
MARSYSFSIVRVGASAPRDERLNVGIAVLEDERLDVRLPRTLAKLHALSNALDETTVRAAAENLPEIYKLVATKNLGASDRLTQLRALSPFEFSSPGEFIAGSREAYEAELEGLLRRLVDPEPAPPKTRPKKPSHLATVLRKAFRKERILAQKGEELSAHRVLTNLVLAEGFSADFVLKNGSFHVIETVDAAGPNASPRKAVADIAVSALTIEQARIHFGESETKGRLVYQASAATEAAADSALTAAEHQGIELVNWASQDDQRKLLVTVSSLAEPLPKKRDSLSVHASTQHRLSLH